jgi:hypothetical protein
MAGLDTAFKRRAMQRLVKGPWPRFAGVVAVDFRIDPVGLAGQRDQCLVRESDRVGRSQFEQSPEMIQCVCLP